MIVQLNMKRLYPILILGLLALTCFFAYAKAEAREIVYGKARETIPVAFGAETLFRFPMEVKTITEANRFEIRPANPDEPDYSILTVKPRMSEGASDVAFVLADGSVIRTQLTISNKPNLKKDSIYDFKPKDELSETNPNLSEKRDPMVISELDLMRAMIRGDRVSGYDVSRHSQAISLDSPHLTAQLVKVYNGKEMNGYVYLLKTESKDKVFEVNLASLAIGQPNLAVLSQIDRAIIGGEKAEDRQALLRIVAKPGASSQKVVLPVAIRKDERGV